MPVNIYLAGHLHTDWRNQTIAEVLSLVSREVRDPRDKVHWLLPMRDLGVMSGPPGNDRRFYVPNDIQMVNRADIIAFNLEKGHGNIGGAWEVGYAYAEKKPVYLFDQDTENYRYDILRATSHVFVTNEEFVRAIAMAVMTA